MNDHSNDILLGNLRADQMRADEALQLRSGEVGKWIFGLWFDWYNRGHYVSNQTTGILVENIQSPLEEPVNTIFKHLVIISLRLTDDGATTPKLVSD